jgi:hypothetical protein
VLGLGVAIAPQAASAIDQLPPVVNRILAFVILGVLATYMAWVWRTPRVVGRHNWLVTLPNGPLTLLQIAVGIVDLGCCAGAMYMLVPDEPYIGFVTLAVIFVSSTLLGFASHSPGGLGVFDAAMLVALWQFDTEDLVASLLLFRVLYYLVPFVLSLTILGGRKIWLYAQAVRSIKAPKSPLSRTERMKSDDKISAKAPWIELIKGLFISAFAAFAVTGAAFYYYPFLFPYLNPKIIADAAPIIAVATIVTTPVAYFSSLQLSGRLRAIPGLLAAAVVFLCLVSLTALAGNILVATPLIATLLARISLVGISVGLSGVAAWTSAYFLNRSH